MLFTEKRAQSATPSGKARSYSYQALSMTDEKPFAKLTESDYYELDPESAAALTSQRLCKAFTLWRSEVCKRKRDFAKAVLHIDLFILDSVCFVHRVDNHNLQKSLQSHVHLNNIEHCEKVNILG